MARLSHAEAIRRGTERLQAVSDTPRLDAEYLMSEAARIPRADLWRLDIDGEAAPVDAYEVLIQRRLAREPLAYILGNQEFFGRTFRVTRDVLIPRSDSETLIYAAQEHAARARRVLDMGTGSGALFVTALLELEDAAGVAIDASQAALHVAENNAQRLGLGRKQAKFLLRDWTQPGWAEGLGQFDLVLCNPPYVEEDAALDSDVRDYEPASALFAGPEGLDEYRVIIPQLGKLLVPGGVAVLEIGASQEAAVSSIARESGFSVNAHKDLGGRPRALVLR
ncbi:peptide chain release factor N(5)-glutamine methyltransferase [Qipengyuania flava]|uniref:peptide chain release factor N(5)-glutamine methyltransferase n=1 Tax=Qipengyuania flava TaxID=192812 RepID=UPI001C633E79|nr:peptide chain release factor N(5)-glutamine methyltransferase [Qipengyuania flava]QYJ07100.1 peptide chain release factor N(5)-glutamine methyltransferase [Qipengyuania flava]